ncbi:MlaC/ttg2D family ABC transporter substrate-binding protein [Alcaligenes endophyticus]|uniref:ABC transporter substrate-binding protein n=1 Tax=Alcaligenes endophyticus TaxID=1929088 RepID=A0ABT8EFE3_9BURK|nr:ABC transporter substrate-binding protein [Alcaligenes endophyticus]MCX5590356.1 ABC transporter substrate-binding protein [Alcaligenes endophyticus]MDN4119980.1 ABC transporter substrate-binding protein [Alcaligenes endophyticus]
MTFSLPHLGFLSVALPRKQLITCAASLILFCVASVAQANTEVVNPNGPPAEFVEAVASNALAAVKTDEAIRKGDRNAITEAVNTYVMPYVNFEKTTRLAAGRHWRQADEQQRKDLTEAFKNTLIRTYSGALAHVDTRTALTILPFRGDPKAEDVVVRSSLIQPNGSPVGVDYRLERTPEGWRVYDLNVEGIWLIQNYRNQFAEQIAKTGIDGLIKALNSQAQTQ